MNPTASQVAVAHSFLKGAVDVLSALLGLDFAPAPDMLDNAGLGEADTAAIEETLAGYPVAMKAGLKRGGAVAMLFAPSNACELVDRVSGQDPSGAEELDDTALATLLETAEAMLGGGVSSIMEAFGQDPEQLEDLSADRQGDAAELAQLLGAGAVLAPVRIIGKPGLDLPGCLLFSKNLEDLAPAEGAAVGDLAADAQLSEAEMSDILSGFSPDAMDDIPMVGEPAAASAPGAAPAAAAPTNLSLVLDILLEARARLGRVEMPIADILALGPGSIIEVGHSVDEPIELLVNDKLIARGDVVVVDEKFGLRITEIVSAEERIESLR